MLPISVLPISAKTILAYIRVYLLPYVAAAVSTYLVVHVHILGALGFGQSAIASAVVVVGIWVSGLVVAFLVQHHILLGQNTPTPPAKVPYA